MAFSYTAEQFQARTEFFSARSVDAIEAAIAEAKLYVSLDVCRIDREETDAQSLYDSLVETKTVCVLLSGSNGMPTSVTKESALLEQAERRFARLKMLATPRCGVAGGCA
jgi:hypothetical protein